MSWEYVKTRSTFQDLWMISPRLKKYVLRTTPRDHVVFDISLKTRRCHGNTSRRGILFKGLSMISPCLKKYVLRTTPRDHVDFEISLRTRRCHENTSRRGILFKGLSMISPRRETCSPRDDIVLKVLFGRGDSIGIHIETRSTFQRTVDNISPTWNIF